MQTSIANTLDLKEQIQCDACSKRILSNRHILAWILKECTVEFAKYSIEEIVKDSLSEIRVSTEPVDQDIESQNDLSGQQVELLNSEDNSVKEGSITYDIRLTAKIPEKDNSIFLIINIEAQKSDRLKYPLLKRAVYYCSRLISAQKNKFFSNTHYEKIRKVYSVWITMNTSAEKSNTITRYSITEHNVEGAVKERPQNYDLMTIVILRLGDEGLTDSSILRMLDVIFTSKKKPQERKTILEETYSIPMTHTLSKEINDMCNFSEGFYERGISQGISQEQIVTINKLLKKNFNLEQIKDIYEELSDEEFNELYKKALALKEQN